MQIMLLSAQVLNPSQSKVRTSKECFSTRVTYWIREVELYSLKHCDRGAVVSFTALTKFHPDCSANWNKSLLRWAVFHVCMCFYYSEGFSNMYLYTFLLLFDTMMISSAAQIPFSWRNDLLCIFTWKWAFLRAGLS